MKSLVEISQLEKRIDDFQLGPIELHINPGTITALVGNNGSGKSTLLKLMMHMANSDKGNIKIDGHDIHGKNEAWKQSISYQPQTVYGWDAFTANTLKQFISKLYPLWEEELFMKLVHLFEIPLNKKFGKLSQGLQQKLSLALTLPRNTPIVLLDEPTAYMDIPSKNYLMDILMEWMDNEPRSIIMASHQSSDIMKLADYLYVLKHGKVIGSFEKEELQQRFQQYWLSETLPDHKVPGEVLRAQNKIISNQPEATEVFLQKHQLHWIKRKSLDLDEIITLLLK